MSRKIKYMGLPIEAMIYLTNKCERKVYTYKKPFSRNIITYCLVNQIIGNCDIYSHLPLLKYKLNYGDFWVKEFIQKDIWSNGKHMVFLGLKNNRDEILYSWSEKELNKYL